jgi:tripartite-type tricarboxylate transporter receptor subunit TctC
MRVNALVAAMAGRLFTLPGCIAAAASQGAATSYPKEAVHIDGPSSAGGATDIVARIVAQK